MRRLLRRAAHAVLLVSLALFVSGCGIIDAVYMPPSEDTAEELFESGNDAMREQDYSRAIDAYTRLNDAYQFSPYKIEAELSLADALFLDSEWVAAIEAYKEFEGLHPRHEAIPYVLYNIGMANYNYYPSIDHPIAPIDEAYAYFKRIYDSYPDSEYAEGAFEYMGLCRRLMAEHEIYVADFYFRMERYNSAWLRYRDIVSNYKDIPDLYSYAEEKAHAAFIFYREDEGAEIREQREGSWKDWFSWL